MSKGKYSLRYLFFLLSMYLFIFQNLLQNYISTFQYFDEAFALLIIPIGLCYIIKQKKYGDINWLKVFLIGLNLIGYIASYKYKYQNFNIVIADSLIISKFFMIYYVASKIWDLDMINRYRRNLVFNVKIIINVLFLLTILEYLFEIFPSDTRYGILSNKLFYSHQTYLAAITIFLYALYIMASRKVFDIYVLLLITILISTLRIKAFGGAVIVFFVIFVVWKSKKQFSLNRIAILGVIFFVLFYNSISYYFFTDRTDMARTQILNNSISVANDYFPIGAGFATYGSYYSGVSYSPLYYKYGMSNTWGLSPNYYDFVSDSFWPMILGQFGYIGVLLYILILIQLFYRIQKSFEPNNITFYMAKLICYIYLLVSSIAENSFAGPIAISFAVIIGLSDKHRRLFK